MAHGAFSQPGPWRPAVGARLARTLGVMNWSSLLPGLLEWVWRILGVTLHIRVRAHRARFSEPRNLAGRDAYFIAVVNLSLSREVEITHAGFELPGGQVAADLDERPLPVRLKPQETWSTWAMVSKFNGEPPSDTPSRARVRLSDGRIIKGKFDPAVPHTGFVPGHKTSK